MAALFASFLIKTLFLESAPKLQSDYFKIYRRLKVNEHS